MPRKLSFFASSFFANQNAKSIIGNLESHYFFGKNVFASVKTHALILVLPYEGKYFFRRGVGVCRKPIVWRIGNNGSCRALR